MNKKKTFSKYLAFQVIKRVHDGSKIAKLINPEKILSDLGLKEGDVVFEPGCGPGFYTLAAAKIVGAKGIIHAYDVNPYMIEHLQEKTKIHKIPNIQIHLQNANFTDLESNSVHFSFLFGLPRIDGGVEKLIKEIARVSCKNAFVAFHAERREPENLYCIMERNGFTLLRRVNEYLVFTKQ